MQFIREHNDRALLAWRIAYLPRSKHPVKLQKLLRRERVVQTAEQMMAIAKGWAMASGHVRKKEDVLDGR